MCENLYFNLYQTPKLIFLPVLSLSYPAKMLYRGISVSNNELRINPQDLPGFAPFRNTAG